MKRLKEFYDNRIRSYLRDDLPLDLRTLNVAAGLGFLALFIASIARLIEGVPLFTILGMLLMGVAIVVLVVLSNKYGMYRKTPAAVVFLMTDVLFPYIFFTNGGIDSGMAAYFALSIMLIFLLTRGMLRLCLFTFHILVIIACYCLGEFLPGTVIVRLNQFQRLIDNFQSIIVAGLFVGLIFVYQRSIYSLAKKRSDDALAKLERESRTRSALFSGSPHVNILIGDKFQLLDCNQAALDFLGVPDKETLFKNFYAIVNDLIPPFQSSGRPSISMADRLKAAVKNGRVQFGTELRREGKILITTVTMRRIPYNDSFAIVINLVDLSDLYAAQQSLAHRANLLAAVNGAAEILLSSEEEKPAPLLEKSVKLIARCVQVNRVYIWKSQLYEGSIRYHREFGWEDGALPEIPPYGEGKDDIYRDSFAHWEREFAQSRCINGAVKNFPQDEQDMLSPYGVRSILAVPVIIRDNYWGFVAFEDCLKDRRFSEEEETILRSAGLLMSNTIQRGELLQTLIRAREAAFSSARAKASFLANMSHEMRTPLNAVVGMTAIGKAAAGVEKKDACFDKIENASNHLLGVINDVLDMSKIEANKLELSPVEFSFESMLRQVSNVITFKVDEKRQKFMVHIGKNIPQKLIGDDQRLAQVITNLLSNAVKFTPEEGSITMDTRLLKQEGKLCTIEVEITDTGIGISKEQQARLFDSFQQADNNTTRRYGGTGLGLTISKRIVQLMGGDIWLESAPGKGSTFGFTAVLEEGAYESPRRLLDPEVHWDNVKIIVVDDDPDTREYFRDIMQRFSISCDVASDAEEALQLLEKNRHYDIYFIDWKMPGIDGMELSRRIRKHGQEDANSIIIMISAIDWALIEADAKAAGVDRYLPKPLFPSSVADCINECLSRETILSRGPEPEIIENFEGRRMLLVEDVDINREIVSGLLEPTGISIDCAENGLEAVSLFKEAPRKYDLIFMDMQMPEMDGLEATRRIRAFEEEQAAARGGSDYSPVPIIAMTANVFKEDIEKCLEAGMNSHLGKPLDLKEMLETMRLYL